MANKQHVEADQAEDVRQAEDPSPQAHNQSDTQGKDGATQTGEVEALRAELEAMKDKYVRQAAEFENFKKRNARERMELVQTAGRETISSLLDVVDDAERAEKQIQQTDDMNAVRQGVSLVFQKLRSALQARGLRPMQSVGEDFDPDKHEAITEVPAPSPELKGKVIDEVQKGYYLNDKIIRFAKVVVGK